MKDKTGYKILFVDDEQAVLDNFMLLFGRSYSVHVANSVDAAKEVLNRLGDMDVVVSDLRMPGKSGLDLLQWIKELYPDTVRILLTGYADVETAVRAVNSINIFRLLTKPCSKEVLGDALSDACFMREVSAVQQIMLEKKAPNTIMEEVVHSLTYLVEQWDAYTAFHQKRVADLSVSIGLEMELDEDRLRTLEQAALIHDLGKVFIPLAYLNKSGSLNDMEMAVIREHPAYGSRMLSQIEWMKDIAGIVAQHHERIDGSGYPLGLTGDSICLEAKIIAVADTVEAMSSHRPYRPSLGLEKALDELREQKGRRYDPRVVDAACRVLSNRTTETFTSCQETKAWQSMAHM